MLRSVLIGVVAGMRSLTPIAAISLLAQRKTPPAQRNGSALLSSRAVSSAVTALALGEVLGDKLRIAPDRIVAPGIVMRSLTGAFAAMALAPREERAAAAVIGAASAVGAGYLTFALRTRAIQRFGQTSTGFIEDAAAVAGAIALVSSALRR